MTIQCCKNCVAPKRHTACWGHFPEYLAQRAEYDKLKAEDNQMRKVGNDIYQQRADRVTKALKRHGRL